MKSIIYTIHKYLLYTFIFLLPWQTIYIIREVFYGDEKWQYGTVGIYVSDITLIFWIILSIILYHKYIEGYVLRKKRLIFSMLAIIIWTFASSLWVDDSTIALYFATLLFFGFIIFVFVQCTPLSKTKIANIFITSIALQSIIGFIQFTSQQTFSQKILGLQYHNVWSGGNAVISTGAQRWLRDYGAMTHPNIFGMILVCAIIITIGLYITNSSKNKITQFLYLLSIGLFSINLLFTFSRTSWLMAIVGIICILILTYRSKLYSTQKLLAPLLMLGGITIVITMLLSNIFFTRVTHDSLSTHNSINDRKLYIAQSIAQIKNSPLLGTGIANYTNTVSKSYKHSQPIWLYQPVHNIYLLITAELGIIGIILFCIFFFLFFKDIWKQKNTLSFMNKIFFIIVILLLFTALFDHWLWTTHLGLFIFFLFAGLIYTKR